MDGQPPCRRVAASCELRDQRVRRHCRERASVQANKDSTNLPSVASPTGLGPLLGLRIVRIRLFYGWHEYRTMHCRGRAHLVPRAA